MDDLLFSKYHRVDPCEDEHQDDCYSMETRQPANFQPGMLRRRARFWERLLALLVDGGVDIPRGKDTALMTRRSRGDTIDSKAYLDWLAKTIL